MDKLLNVKKPEFKVLDDEAKTETMGKLKVLEFLLWLQPKKQNDLLK